MLPVKPFRVFVLAFLVFIASSAFLLAQNIPDSCGSRDWFQLRDRLAQGSVSLLCEGVMNAAFEHRRKAERELKEVIRKDPNSSAAFDAHETLISLYFRHGEYRKALLQVDQGLRERPDASDLKGFRSMVTVLAKSRDLHVAHRTRSVVQGEMIGDDFFIPLTINGVGAAYGPDTGANISVICESEAKRFGLTIRETSTKLSDIVGTASAIKLADAPDLWIGNVHLKNVAFAVFPDGNRPFADFPNGHKGILGIPVLLALESIRVEKNGRIVIGPEHETASGPALPLAFDAQNPLMQIDFQGRPLTFTFDTGAGKTYLYKPLADAFPGLIKTGEHRQQKVAGLSGNSFQEAIDVPSLLFPLAEDVEVELKPATIIMNATTDSSKWTAGNFGFDLLLKALPATIDFRAMQISFENR
jgi:hypothetical protein